MGQLEFKFLEDPKHLRLRQAVKEFGLASGLVFGSLLLRLVVAPREADALAYVVFFPAVIIAVSLFRRGAALFTIGLSLLLTNWFFVAPRYSLATKSIWHWVAACLFLVAGLALLFFSERRRRAGSREQQARQALQARTVELSASEEFNRRMLASIPDCVNMLSMDGLILSINEAGKRLFQISDPSAWLRQPWLNIWPEDHRQSAEAAIDRAKLGDVAHFLAECPTVQGRKRWWDVVVSPINDGYGRPERLLVISRDVTERHQTEARRQESEERRRLALAATGDAVWDLDVPNNRFTVNERYQNRYSSPSEENWQQWWRERIHPEDQERVQAALLLALKGTATTWMSEYRFLRSDGRWGHVLDRAFIARNSDGQPRRVVGAMMDLLPLRKAEWRAELLAETSRLLLITDPPQSIVESLCERVAAFLDCEVFFNFLIDTKTGRLRLNTCRGLPPDDQNNYESVDSATVCGCVALNGAPTVIENVQESTDSHAELAKSLGVRAYVCNPLIVRGKTIGTLSFGTKTRTRFEDEELTLIKAVTDQVAIAMERQLSATELRRINEELEKRVRERTQSLAETTEKLNSFCYSVAHDLRAPLRTQTGFAHLLLDEYSERLDETGRHYLKAIMQAAERQSNIIQDLMAHVNVSRADLTIESIEMESAVQQARSDLEIELQQRHAVLDTSRLTRHKVLANRSSLHLVLLNLISNAYKFVPAGVRPRIQIRTQADGSRIRLWIEDNGIGIAPEDHKRLFGMFQRLNKGNFPGTGMGLAIVKTAVEKMGGAVGLYSEPGKGSRFWIDLKKAPAPAPRIKTVSEPHYPSASR